ncbi:hypothetical protein EAO72_02520 [Streptomyces sp. or43]|nr:DUF6215 domain-containing protein [Streptomyces sp. or43]TXS48989.1 hypothetical protein EAO72_02520 [Streptomyces sp. or43]
MFGLLLRRLPFWVREPVFILVGSVFGARIMYVALRDHSWVAAGIGVVFLVGTALRIRTVVRTLRARRSRTASVTGGAPSVAGMSDEEPRQAGAAAGTVPPQQPGAGPAPSRKEPNVWGQTFAAVALFGALAAAVWAAPKMAPDDNSAPKPASCSNAEREELPQAYARTPKAVTGDELCTALNRPGLAQLLGTPDERATTAYGTSGTAPLTGGKIAEPEAEVQFDTYTVHLSATYNKLSIAQYVKMLTTGGEEARTLEVLGRPAVFSSDHTMRFDLSRKSGPLEEGPLARTLSVAFDRKDGGGSYDITVWSEFGALPDDSALLDIAKEVLPEVPARTAR